MVIFGHRRGGGVPPHKKNPEITLFLDKFSNSRGGGGGPDPRSPPPLDPRMIKNMEDTVNFQKDTDRLGSWARKWGMRFQPVKCNVMLLTNNGLVKFRILTNLRGTSVGKC